jgi:hypothetical protein
MSTSAHAIAIVQPVPVTDAMLISTNIAEADYPEWNSGTTYALGDRVILTSTHRVYESLQADNLNKNPTTEPTWWIEVGPTNRWKAFDTSNTTQTVTDGGSPPTIAYTLRPGQAINALAVLNVTNCTELHVQMVDFVYGTVYDKVISFVALPLSSTWWDWFFGQRRAPTQSVMLDLPAFPNADLKLTFTGGAELAVGVIMFGQQQRYGLGVRYGARVGIQDYSRKETNEFGDTTLIRRAFAKRARFDMLIERGEVDPLQNYLAGIRAVPCLWVVTNEYEATVVYGFYKNFDILISYPEHADCELEIEGLT